MEKIKTVKKECKIEFEEKKSKFIGYVKPVFSKEEAEEYIRHIKNLHSDATHNCSAYRIPYERLSEVEKLLKDYEAEIIDKSFLEKIIFKVRINKDFYDNLENYSFINLLDI